MIYAAISVWLMIIVLLAWVVHHLWTTIAKPKAVHWVLLPGTFVAQTGRTIGLLITGAKINNTALMDEENGAPATDPHYESKIPVFGPVVVGLLPMLATGATIYFIIRKLGMPVVTAAPQDQISSDLPTTLSAFWDQLRALITQAEGTLNAVLATEMTSWKSAAFVYLMTCLTVRMAPFSGNARGHFGAIVATGGILALIGTISPQPAEMIEQAWPLVSLTVGWLMILAMFSLLTKGVVSIVQAIVNWE